MEGAALSVISHIKLAEHWEPVVIIGAPRSGTNMLRDALTSLSGVATWPCDEINYIWRHGNVRYPSDEFKPDMARSEIQAYVRRKFDRVARYYQADLIVEKTCANSLRVDFVNRILPEAKYIFIRRDGLDVVGSAMKRWAAALDISYLLQKARFVPLFDLPYYAGRYFFNRVYRLVSGEKRLAFWGPQLDDMDSLLKQHTLEEVCALQWKRCIDSAMVAFGGMDSRKYLEVEYEAFVRTPVSGLRRVMEFLGRDSSEDAIRQAVRGVSQRSLGKGREALGEGGIKHLQSLIGDTLSRCGYV